MSNLPALLVSLSAVKKDLALRAGGRGARKLLVTQIREETEQDASDIVWHAPEAFEKCPVQVTANIELAVFNQYASQDRHYHKIATEIYTVLEGTLHIDVEDSDYELIRGDTIVINPGVVHEIKPQTSSFLCSVVIANCRGVSDKYSG